MLTAAIDHLWQSTLFLVAIALAARWMKSDAAKVRSALWVAASIKFLVPLSVLVTLGTTLPIEGIGDSQVWHGRSAQYVFQPLAVASDLVKGIASGSTTQPRFPYFSAVVALWLLGSLALSVHRARGWMQVRRIVTSSKRSALSWYPIPVRITSVIHGPAVAGVLRPVLLLPGEMQTTLSEAEFRAVLAHEYEHVRRHDNLLSAIHGVVEILFWFYPPVWWLSKRLVLDRERACDEAVLLKGHAPEVYAEAILKICERFACRTPLRGAAAATGSDLHQRIEAIMNQASTHPLNRLKTAVLCLLFGAATVGPLATGIAAPKETNQEPARTNDRPADSHNALLGRHSINLRLKGMPVAQVLEILSARSTWGSRIPDPPSDEGRRWTVEGAGLLDGVFVAVNFTDTPVDEVVSRVLGCVGFGYRERDDRIDIVSIARPLPSSECRSVERVPAPDISSVQASVAAAKLYSWQLESVSAFDFVQHWSSESGRNVITPHTTVDTLKKISLRVNVSNMRDEETIDALMDCIGWKYEKIGETFTLSEASRPLQAQCRGFAVL